MEFFHFFLDISSVIKATPGVCLLYLLFPHPKFFFRSGIHRGNIVLSYFEGRSFTVYVCPTYTCPFVYMSNWKKKNTFNVYKKYFSLKKDLPFNFQLNALSHPCQGQHHTPSLSLISSHSRIGLY